MCPPVVWIIGWVGAATRSCEVPRPMVARFRADAAAVKGQYALTEPRLCTWTTGGVLVLAAVSLLAGFCYAIYFWLNLGEERSDPDEL